MKKLGAKSRPSLEFSSGAMSDIAFLLLIFFLVTTIFALEKGIPMALPGQQSQNVKVQRKNILTVKAYANGSVTIDDDPVSLAAADNAFPRDQRFCSPDVSDTPEPKRDIKPRPDSLVRCARQLHMRPVVRARLPLGGRERGDGILANPPSRRRLG